MKSVQLILRNIIKIVATRCQILRQNAPNSISAGAPSQTPLGSLQRPLCPLVGFEGLLLREGREKGRGERRGEGQKGGERGKRREGGEGRGEEAFLVCGRGGFPP